MTGTHRISENAGYELELFFDINIILLFLKKKCQ